jgi:fructose transport system ATP-binding protein
MFFMDRITKRVVDSLAARKGICNMASQDRSKIILQAKGVSKYFGGVTALDNVDLDLREGEVLAIVGDNGAGKSTLVKAITGAIPKTSGTLIFDGAELRIDNPSDAKAAGIETVYQDLALVNEISITKNVFLGREIVKDNIFGRLFGVLDFQKMESELRNLFQKLDIRISDIYRDAQAFSGGQRQAVALSKTVMFGKRIAIQDEPTAALGVRESKMAMDLVSSLKDHGLSVIMITHNMQHVLNYCDRVMVLRLGKLVTVRDVKDIDGDMLVGLITGAIETKAA